MPRHYNAIRSGVTTTSVVLVGGVPGHDPLREHVDDEGHPDESGPGPHASVTHAVGAGPAARPADPTSTWPLHPTPPRCPAWHRCVAQPGHSDATALQRVHRGAGCRLLVLCFNAEVWIGHNGDIPGYTTVLVYLPQRDATLVVTGNSDAPKLHAAEQLATDITSIATPGHVC